MNSPVYVIHGIGARDRESFAKTAEELGAAAGFHAVPVFWGDLGARTAMLERTVPGRFSDEVRDESPQPADAEQAMKEFLASSSQWGAVPHAETRGDQQTLPQEVLEAIRETEIRDTPTEPDVEQSLREEWPSTRWLCLVDDPELLRAVGEALAGPIAEDDSPLVGSDIGYDALGSEEIRDEAIEEIREVKVAGYVKRRLHELDRVVGAVLGLAGGRINSELRSSMLPGITQYVGDVLVYQRHRDLIHDRVRSIVAQADPGAGRSPENPVDIVAHSLGGVIAVDMATADEPLWVRNLITFGSQSPLFHVCDPRGGALAPFDGSALVQLPPSLGRWINLWEPLDLLAFIAARVFVLHDGSPPDDRAVPHLVSSGLWSHSAYWKLSDVAQAIEQAFRPVGD